MTTTLKDLEEEGESNCCGAKVYLDICSDCGEHCEAVGYDCEICQDNGFIIKTEWTEVDGKDMDYERKIKCECQYD